ncbi:hypothetical protein BGZ83_002669 [Gryganskiella cystojenkinii]|nr:hypothetical protein BGZ83_002669 [Gryganskiella cystojenkinii]
MTSHPSAETQDQKKPRVIIAGAGIGGLFLAILLDRAGIPYELLESASEVKPIGSVLGINANILPAFEQLGFFEELKKLALPWQQLDFQYGNMEKITTIDANDTIDLIGYHYEIFHRADFYQFLLSKIPAGKIQFNKKVVSTMQNTEEVVIRCSDGEFHYGDMLVGADGANSAVRHSLFDNMKYDRILPIADEQQSNIGFTSLEGTTESLDPVRYSLPNDQCLQHQVLVDGTPYTYSLFNVRGNRICYVVVRQYATKAEAEKDRLQSAEWLSSKGNDEMIEKVKDFKLPIGGTLGDLIDKTPRDKISRAFLEDKVFDTWTYGRTVLIGDAAHKPGRLHGFQFLPSCAQGAVNAMQDAVILANVLYDLKAVEHKEIKAALKDYKEQRYPQAKIQRDNSNVNATLFFGQTLMERCVRHAVFNWMPKFMMTRTVVKDASYRPQLSFLPQAPTRGTGYIQSQKPSWRYEEELRKKKETNAAVATANNTLI